MFWPISTFKFASEQVTEEQIRQGIDPSVEAQRDTTTPMEKQLEDLYGMMDSLKACQLVTQRLGGKRMVSRCMAIGKREGPDILLVCSRDSNKIKEIEAINYVNLTFLNSSTFDWISLSGSAQILDDKATIKNCFFLPEKAWFGDVGDGIHNATSSDPRMRVIKVTTEYVSYWKHTRTRIGTMMDVAISAWMGKIATPGIYREIEDTDLQRAREALH